MTGRASASPQGQALIADVEERDGADTPPPFGRSFLHIFWGLLLLFWDVSYNGFDFLVDGVGFLLIALGCAKLAAHSSKFKLSQKIALVLAALWLIFSVILPSLKMSAGSFGFALGVIGRVLDMLMVWFVCSGIRELAMERELLKLAKKATRRGIAYAVMNLGMWIFGSLLSGLGLFLILLNFIVLGFILHLLLVARRELSAEHTT